MIRKILTVLVLIPLGVVLVVLSVANRQPATLRLDPFNEIDPAIVFTLPLFVMVLLAVLVGMIIGAIAVWFSQGKHRRALKRQQAEAKRWRDEAEAQKSAATPWQRRLPVPCRARALRQQAALASIFP
ncbi:MAG: LapA family protein [Nitratireductor sp.]